MKSVCASFLAWTGRVLHAALSGFLIVTMVLPPRLPRAHADEGGDAGESYTFSESSSSASEASAGDAAKNALKVRTAPVSASGAYQTRIEVPLPPGRLGMTPALSINYASDRAGYESALGAGWALSSPQIERSSDEGFPKLIRERGRLRYDPASTFTGPAGRLVQLSSAGGLTVTSGARVYAPEREQEPVRYEYIPTEDAWIEHAPQGKKRYFGGVAGGAHARVVNELGTHAWLLLRESDPSGNTIDYDYHHIDDPLHGEGRCKPPASACRSAQYTPVLRSVRWGGNVRSGRPHPFRVQVAVGPYEGPLDMLRGHQVLSSDIRELTIHGPDVNGATTEQQYMRYVFELTPSKDTGRLLLRSVTLHASDATSLTRRFVYSENDESWSVPVTDVGRCSDTRAKSFGTRTDLPPELAETLQLGRRATLDEESLADFLEQVEPYRSLTPEHAAQAYQFVDLDANGQRDILYHPAGLHVPNSRWLARRSFLRARGAFTFAGEDDGANALSLPSSQLVSDFADSDGDLDPDALSFPLYVQRPFVGGERQALYHDPGAIDTRDLTIEQKRNALIAALSLVSNDGTWPDVNCRPVIQQATLAYMPVPEPVGTGPGRWAPPFVRLRGWDMGLIETLPPFWLPECPPGDGGAYARPQGHGTIELLVSRNGARGEPSENFVAIQRWPNGVNKQVTLRLRGQLINVTENERILGYPPPSSDEVSDEQVEALWQRLTEPASLSAPRLVWSGETRQLSDFQAPLVDVNADGRADIVLLKDLDGTAFSGTPRYEYVPRVFLANGKGFDLDWRAADVSHYYFDLSEFLPDWTGARGQVLRDYFRSVRPLLPQLLGNKEPPKALLETLPKGTIDDMLPVLRAALEAKSLSDKERAELGDKLVRIADEHVLGKGESADIFLEKALDAALTKGLGESGLVKGVLAAGARLRPVDKEHVVLGLSQLLDAAELGDPRIDLSGLLDRIFPEQGEENGKVPASAFTASALNVLTGGEGVGCEHLDLRRCDAESTFPSRVNFHSWFLDLNADGLPDLITAQRPVRHTPKGFEKPITRCVSGHAVHLNRGYRWDTHDEWQAHATLREQWSVPPEAARSPALDHPLLKLRNRSDECNPGSPLEDLNLGAMRLPMGSMQMTDIDADGRADLVFAAQLREGAASHFTQHVYLNRNRGFVRASKDLGSEKGASCVLPPELAFTSYDLDSQRELAPGATRLVDVDDDGLVDLLHMGVCTRTELNGGTISSVCSKAQWQRNLRNVPDLLKSDTQHAGAFTTIEYVAAHSAEAQGVIGEPGDAPAGQRVVSRITRAAAPAQYGVFPGADVETISMRYDNFVRESASNRALGFERVTATFVNSYEGVAEPVPLVTTMAFDVREHVPGNPTGLSHPLRGELVWQSSAWGDARLEERFGPLLTPLDVEPVEGKQAVRVRPLHHERRECVGAECVVVRTEFSEHDPLGYPQRVVEGPVDERGRIALGAPETRRLHHGFEHRMPTFQVGLPVSTSVFGSTLALDGTRSSDVLLSQKEMGYDEHARQTSIHELLDLGSECSEGDELWRDQELAYDGEGFLLTHTVIDASSAGEDRQVRRDPDRLNLFAKSVRTTVKKPTEIVVLSEGFEYDPRTGKARSRRDMNGSTFRSEYDGRGRLLRSYGPGDVLLESHVYADMPGQPPQVDTVHVSDVGTTYGTRTYLNGQGKVLAELERVPASRHGSGRFRRVRAVRYDAWGRPRRELAPRFATSLADVAERGLELARTASYDGFGRPLSERLPDGRESTRSYTVTRTSGGPRKSESVRNARGYLTTRVLDAHGALLNLVRSGDGDAVEVSVSYERDGLGRALRVQDGESVRELAYDVGGRLRSTTLPHAPGAAALPYSFCYDLEDRPIDTLTPSGRRVSTERDVLGRSTRIRRFEADRGAGPEEDSVVTLSYDGPAESASRGRLYRYADAQGDVYFGYDAHGRRTRVDYELSDELLDMLPAETPPVVSVETSHTLAGQVKGVDLFGFSAAIHDRHGFRIGHDPKGLPSTMDVNTGSDWLPLVLGARYDAFERAELLRFGNGTSARRTFDAPSGFLTAVTLSDGSGAFSTLEYPLSSYDASGNPWLERQLGAGASVLSEKSHTFDALDRLTATASRLGTEHSDESFAYTAGGNITEAGGQRYLYEDPSLAQAVTQIKASEGGPSHLLGYDDDGWLRADERSYADGSRETRDLTFDASGCLRRVKSTLTRAEGGESSKRVSEHVCGLGQKRILRTTTEGDRTERVVYLPSGLELRPDENLVTMRVKVGPLHVAKLAWDLRTGELRRDESAYLHNDLRGSVIAETELTSPARRFDAHAEYGPWGARTALGDAALPRYGYVAEEPDPGDGYYHYGARVYDPALRRWLSPDPLYLQAPELDGDGAELNLYAYASNNPVRFIDPSGFDPIKVAFYTTGDTRMIDGVTASERYRQYAEQYVGPNGRVIGVETIEQAQAAVASLGDGVQISDVRFVGHGYTNNDLGEAGFFFSGIPEGETGFEGSATGVLFANGAGLSPASASFMQALAQRMDPATRHTISFASCYSGGNDGVLLQGVHAALNSQGVTNNAVGGYANYFRLERSTSGQFAAQLHEPETKAPLSTVTHGTTLPPFEFEYDSASVNDDPIGGIEAGGL